MNHNALCGEDLFVIRFVSQHFRFRRLSPLNMPDYAEVAGVTNAYSNGQSHTSQSPLYDSCGAYATTSLIGTTNIYHQNRYENQQQAPTHYNNVIRNGPFVYPNKKTSSTSLNTPKMEDTNGEEGGREKLNNTFGGNRTNTLSYGIRNRLMKMNITENKMDILINNLGAKGAVSQNGSIKSIQKPTTSEGVIPIPPPTPNLGSTRRNQFLANGGNNNPNLHVSKKNLFPNEAPPIIKSYLDPETDDEDDDQQQQQLVGLMNGGIGACDRTRAMENGGGEGGRDAVNSSSSSINNHNNNNRNKSQQRHLLSGDNQSLNGGGGSPCKNQMPNKSNKSLNSSSASSSPYHMINHRRNGGGSPATTVLSNNGGIQAASSSLMLDSSQSTCLSTGNSASSSSGCSSASSPLLKKNFTGSDNQINGSPNYMKSFGKTDNV